jgi:uncharacterized damage-inducible protein DinB
VNYTSVADIYAANDEVRRRLVARVENLDEARQQARAAAGGWSVAEIVEHLSLIERQLTTLFEKWLRRAEDAREGETRSDDSEESPRPFTPFSLDEYVEQNRERKFVAPETAQPAGASPVADSLARLEETRTTLERLRPRFEMTDLTTIQYPHPAFGALNLAQWLAFIGIHEARHVGQIGRILKETMKSER